MLFKKQLAQYSRVETEMIYSLKGGEVKVARDVCSRKRMVDG